MEHIECIDPKCSGTWINRPHLSTWAVDVHFCSGCKRSFRIPTWLGKLAMACIGCHPYYPS